MSLNQDLEEALSQVEQLHGLFPICSYCKKIRDDQNYWEQIDHYIAKHSAAQFSHGVCPECFEKYAKPDLDQLREDLKRKAQKKT